MKSFVTRRTGIILGGVALLAAGGVAGTVAGHMMEPSVEMAPMKPVAIRSLTADSDGVVTVRGRVTDVFGNKFVLDDGSGHALVDTGDAGEDNSLVAGGNAVTVQGRFDDGQIRASFLVGADGKVQALKRHGHGGDHEDRDHGDRDGDGGDRDRRGPQSAPPQDGAAASVAPAATDQPVAVAPTAARPVVPTTAAN